METSDTSHNSTLDKQEIIDSLRWIRIQTPHLIPRYLVEQIKEREYPIEDFYRFQDQVCVHIEQGVQKLNPLNHLYVLANPENIVKGFLWFIVDPLTKDLIINNYSIDKEYWFSGLSIKKLVDFMSDLLVQLGLKSVFWMTRYPKHSEKFGFKRSKYILMEYKKE